MRTHKHILSLHIHFFNLYMHLWTFTCACKMTLPKFLWVCVEWGMTRLCFSFFFLYFQFLLHYFSCLFVFFLSKVKFHKKATKYKKRNSCFVCWKFLLIKGDGQLDRDTDKQISWLINTNYRREKDVKYFLCYTARMVKKWLQLFFSIFYRKQFKRQKQTEK